MTVLPQLLLPTFCSSPLAMHSHSSNLAILLVPGLVHMFHIHPPRFGTWQWIRHWIQSSVLLDIISSWYFSTCMSCPWWDARVCVYCNGPWNEWVVYSVWPEYRHRKRRATILVLGWDSIVPLVKYLHQSLLQRLVWYLWGVIERSYDHSHFPSHDHCRPFAQEWIRIDERVVW